MNEENHAKDFIRRCDKSLKSELGQRIVALVSCIVHGNQLCMLVKEPGSTKIIIANFMHIIFIICMQILALSCIVSSCVCLLMLNPPSTDIIEIIHNYLRDKW